MTHHNVPINYIEIYVTDIPATKAFYGQAFGWTFTDYGDRYVAFSDSGVEGGFELVDHPIVNGVLVVLYHQELEGVLAQVKNAGGVISKEIFSFPGGRRFHCLDPCGNELAVWSDS